MKSANSKSKNKKKKHKGAAVFIICLAVLAGLLLDSRYRLVETEYEIKSDNLPASFDGFRIVQLSDLHCREYGQDNSRLIEKVRELSPDIIALTGDFLDKFGSDDGGAQTPQLKEFFEHLTEIAPCYYVSGNHEWASGEINQLSVLLEELGIKYLRNEYVLLQRGGDNIVLAGVEDPNGLADMISPTELVDIINKDYPEGFTVLLGHRNYWMEKYPDLKVDIILSGHAHGGIIRLPFAGGVFGTNGDFFPEYDAGRFSRGGYDLIISRGLGDSLPFVRLLNNPEIVSVVLRAET